MSNSENAESKLRSARVLAGAMIGANAMYAAAGIAAVYGNAVPDIELPQETLDALGMAFGALGPGLAAVSLAIGWMARRRTSVSTQVRLAVFGLAVAETPGLMGLVYALLSGSIGLPSILWWCALLASLFHFPRKSWLPETNDGDRRKGVS